MAASAIATRYMWFSVIFFGTEMKMYRVAIALVE
jgi:hypothetical protein